MKKRYNRILSLLLALSLVLSLTAPVVQAAELSEADVSTPESSAAVLSPAEDNTTEETSEDQDPSDISEPENSEEEEEKAAPGTDSSAPVEDIVPQSPALGSEEDESAENPPLLAQEDDLLSTEGASIEEDTQPAVRMTVDSAKELSQFLKEQWSGDYFQEAVVDTKRNRVTVDGESSSVAKAFGPEADKDAILDSPEAAEAYFEDTPYETETLGGGKVSVAAPWQTCRIVVTAKELKEDYGAQTVVEYPAYDQFVLQFADEDATQQAYELLSQRYPCYVDQIYSAENLLEADAQTWGTEYMGTSIPKANGTFSGAKAVQVAIIDSGCYADNAFFEGRTFSSASRSFTDDQTPFVDNESGYHGTHVAGIIHACTPANVELMILRVYDSSGNVSNLGADTALKYALEQGAEVINFSMGVQSSAPSTQSWLDPVLSRARKQGVPVVCSAGNVSRDVACNYPACNEDSIAVSAINRSGQFAYTYSENPDKSNFGTGGSGSSYGSGIDFCAPGVNIVSASKSGTVSKNGTSMAAPHITAALAWLCLEDPSANWEDLYQRLQSLCTDLGDSGKDQLYGWGCPNLSTLGQASTQHQHNWTGVVTAPTCTKEGYTTYTCSGCNTVRLRDYVGPTHSFNSAGQCTTCGKTLNSSCGTGVTWSYNTRTETLTLSGSGTVTSTPWTSLYPEKYIRCVALDGVTGLGDGLFKNCTHLEIVDLGTALKTLGKENFYGCTALKKVNLPETLTAIGESSFCGCTAMNRITNDSSAFFVQENSLLYDADKTRLLACGGAWQGGSFTLPDTVTAIDAHAFEGVAGLTELVLSPKLGKVGDQAFARCTGLKTVYARSSVTSLGSNVFSSVNATLYISQDCTGWTGSMGGTFTRKSYQADLSKWTMSLTNTSWTFTGSKRQPGIGLRYGETFYHNYNIDGENANHEECFSFSYANNIQLGRATDTTPPTAIVKGKGIYYGTQSLPFSITLASPVISAPVCSSTGITISWESVYGADWYALMRKTEGGEWKPLAGSDTQGTSYIDTSAVYGQTYSYGVYCYTNDYKNTKDEKYRSKYKASQPAVLFLLPPTLSSAQLQGDGTVALSWSAVDGAASYRVMRRSADGDTWVILANNITKTSYVDTYPLPGVGIYAVQAANASGALSSYTESTGVQYVPVSTTLSSVESTGKGIQVNWQPMTGAASYRVFCKTGTGNWQQVGTTSGTSLLVKTSDGVNALKAGTTYAFTVGCVPAAGQTLTGSWNGTGMSARYLSVPALSSVAIEGSGIRVKWSKTKGAVKYRVFCKVGSGSWKKVGDTTSASLLAKTCDGKTALKTGKTYCFTVRCITADGKQYESGSNTTGKSQVYVAAPTISSAKNVKKLKLTTKWKKVSGVTGYQLQVALNQSFTSGKKTAKLKGAGKVSNTLTKLKKKTYWVRLRSYKTVSGKTIYSSWSKVKKVAIKK